jgi:hypothetical protein
MARTTDEAFVLKQTVGKFEPKGETPLELLLFQSVIGPIGMPAGEAVYFSVNAVDGKPLNAMNDYVIRMTADELPPTDVFWSRASTSRTSRRSETGACRRLKGANWCSGEE